MQETLGSGPPDRNVSYQEVQNKQINKNQKQRKEQTQELGEMGVLITNEIGEVLIQRQGEYISIPQTSLPLPVTNREAAQSLMLELGVNVELGPDAILSFPSRDQRHGLGLPTSVTKIAHYEVSKERVSLGSSNCEWMEVPESADSITSNLSIDKSSRTLLHTLLSGHLGWKRTPGLFRVVREQKEFVDELRSAGRYFPLEDLTALGDLTAKDAEDEDNNSPVQWEEDRPLTIMEEQGQHSHFVEIVDVSESQNLMTETKTKHGGKTPSIGEETAEEAGVTQEPNVGQSTSCLKVYPVLKANNGNRQNGNGVNALKVSKTDWQSERWLQLAYKLRGEIRPVFPRSFRAISASICCNVCCRQSSSVLSEFDMSLIDVGIRQDGALESNRMDRIRLGLPEEAPGSTAVPQVCEILSLFSKGSINEKIGDAIISIQQGGSKSHIVPLLNSSGEVLTMLEVLPWVKLWEPEVLNLAEVFLKQQIEELEQQVEKVKARLHRVGQTNVNEIRQQSNESPDYAHMWQQLIAHLVEVHDLEKQVEEGRSRMSSLVETEWTRPVRIVECEMQSPVHRNICVMLQEGRKFKTAPGGSVSFSEALPPFPGEEDTIEEVMMFVVSLLARRYLLNTVASFSLHTVNPWDGPLTITSLLVSSPRLDQPEVYGVEVMIRLENHTLEAAFKTAVVQSWYQKNRGILALSAVTDSIHCQTSHGYGYRDVGWVNTARHTSAVGSVVEQGVEMQDSVMVGDCKVVILAQLEANQQLYVLIAGPSKDGLYISDFFVDASVRQRIKESTTPDQGWRTSDDLAWNDLVQSQLESGQISFSCYALPSLSEMTWKPYRFDGVARIGQQVLSPKGQELLTLLNDLRPWGLIRQMPLGLKVTTQNVNGLVHRLGLSNSRQPNHKDDFVAHCKNVAPDLCSFTETHHPPVLGVSGSSQDIDMLDRTKQWGTNAFEPGIVKFFRDINYSGVLGSGAPLRRMGVLAGINQPVERVWFSYDISGSMDFEHGCLVANARMVAFVMRVDDGYLLRVSIYAPNSGGTSADASKDTCSRMGAKLMSFQKISIFIQMVQSLYPGIKVLMDGDFNCVHEGSGQVVMKTMAKGKRVNDTLQVYLGSSSYAFGMAGCTKNERLAMGVLKYTAGMESAYSTASVNRRVQEDNRTAGLKTYVTTDQLRHCMRLPVLDTAIYGNLVKSRIVKESDCLRGRELAKVQLCLDGVLHSHNTVVDTYEVSPDSHPSEPMSRGSDHKETQAHVLGVTSSRFARLTLTAAPGTHLMHTGSVLRVGSELSVPYPNIKVPVVYNRKGIRTICGSVLMRTPTSVVLYQALVSSCPNEQKKIPQFKCLEAMWNQYLVNRDIHQALKIGEECKYIGRDGESLVVIEHVDYHHDGGQTFTIKFQNKETTRETSREMLIPLGNNSADHSTTYRAPVQSYDWKPRASITWDQTRKGAHYSLSAAPFGCLQTVIASIAGSQVRAERVSCIHRWAALELICSWALANKYVNTCYLAAVLFRSVVPSSHRMEHTHKWKQLTAGSVKAANTPLGQQVKLMALKIVLVRAARTCEEGQVLATVARKASIFRKVPGMARILCKTQQDEIPSDNHLRQRVGLLLLMEHQLSLIKNYGPLVIPIFFEWKINTARARHKIAQGTRFIMCDSYIKTICSYSRAANNSFRNRSAVIMDGWDAPSLRGSDFKQLQFSFDINGPMKSRDFLFCDKDSGVLVSGSHQCPGRMSQLCMSTRGQLYFLARALMSVAPALSLTRSMGMSLHTYVSVFAPSFGENRMKQITTGRALLKRNKLQAIKEAGEEIDDAIAADEKVGSEDVSLLTNATTLTMEVQDLLYAHCEAHYFGNMNESLKQQVQGNTLDLRQLLTKSRVTSSVLIARQWRRVHACVVLVAHRNSVITEHRVQVTAEIHLRLLRMLTTKKILGMTVGNGGPDYGRVWRQLIAHSVEVSSLADSVHVALEQKAYIPGMQHLCMSNHWTRVYQRSSAHLPGQRVVIAGVMVGTPGLKNLRNLLADEKRSYLRVASYLTVDRLVAYPRCLGPDSYLWILLREIGISDGEVTSKKAVTAARLEDVLEQGIVEGVVNNITLGAGIMMNMAKATAARLPKSGRIRAALIASVYAAVAFITFMEVRTDRKLSICALISSVSSWIQEEKVRAQGVYMTDTFYDGAAAKERTYCLVRAYCYNSITRAAREAMGSNAASYPTERQCANKTHRDKSRFTVKPVRHSLLFQKRAQRDGDPYSRKFLSMIASIRAEMREVLTKSVVDTYGKYIPYVDTAAILSPVGVNSRAMDLSDTLTVQQHTYMSNRQCKDKIYDQAKRKFDMDSLSVDKLWEQVDQIRDVARNHRGDLAHARDSVTGDEHSPILAAVRQIKAWTTNEQMVVNWIRESSSTIQMETEVNIMDHSEVNLTGVLGRATALYFMGYIQPSFAAGQGVSKRVLARCMLDSGANISLINQKFLEASAHSWGILAEDLFNKVHPDDLPNTGGAFGSTSKATGLITVDLWAPTIPGHSEKWGTKAINSVDSNDQQGYTRSVNLYSYQYVCTDIILGINWSMPDIVTDFTRDHLVYAHDMRPRGAVVTVKCGGTLSDQLDFGVKCIPAGTAVKRNAEYPILVVCLGNVVVPIGHSSIDVVLTGGVGTFESGKDILLEPTSMHPEVHTGVSGLQKEGSSHTLVQFQPSLFPQSAIANHCGISVVQLPIYSEWGGQVRAGDSIAVAVKSESVAEIEGPQSMATGELGKISTAIAVEWHNAVMAQAIQTRTRKDTSHLLGDEQSIMLQNRDVVDKFVSKLHKCMVDRFSELRAILINRKLYSPEKIHQHVRTIKAYVAALEVYITAHPEIGVPALLQCRAKEYSWINDFDWISNHQPNSAAIDNEWVSLQSHMNRLGKVIHFNWLQMKSKGGESGRLMANAITTNEFFQEYEFGGRADRLMWESTSASCSVFKENGTYRIKLEGCSESVHPSVFGFQLRPKAAEVNTSWQQKKECATNPRKSLHHQQTEHEMLEVIEEWLWQPGVNPEIAKITIQKSIEEMGVMNPPPFTLIYILQALVEELTKHGSDDLDQEKSLCICRALWMVTPGKSQYDVWRVDKKWAKEYDPITTEISKYLMEFLEGSTTKSDSEFVSKLADNLRKFLVNCGIPADPRGFLLKDAPQFDPEIAGDDIDRISFSAHVKYVCRRALNEAKVALLVHSINLEEIMEGHSRMKGTPEIETGKREINRVNSMASQFFEQTGVDTMWSIDELVRAEVPTLSFLHASLVEDCDPATDRGFVIDYKNMQLPVSLRQREHVCDQNWWATQVTPDVGEQSVQTSCIVQLSSFSALQTHVNEIYCSSRDKLLTVNSVNNDVEFVSEEIAEESGINMVDETQMMFDPKPPEQPLSGLAIKSLAILDQPKYAHLWDLLPDKARFRRHIESLSDGQILTTRFLEPLLVLWLTESSVFDTDPNYLTKTNVLRLTAKMAGLDMTKPVNDPAHPIPPGLEVEVETLLNQYIKMGIVEPDFGPWNARSIFVAKKDGVNRWCIDYRRLNARMAMIPYPQGTVIQAVTTAAGHRIYTTVDAISAFHQIEAAECIRPALAFTVGGNKYRWTRHPFGLQTGVQCFTYCMQLALGDLKSQSGYYKYKGGAVNWVDDITLFSSHSSHDPEGDHEAIHWELYKEFHHRMFRSSIQLKLKKCEFFADHSSMLGWVCNFRGYQGEDKKISIIKNLPEELKDQKEVQRLVGSLVYYRLMHPAAADELEPLTRLLGKGKSFIWGPEQTTAVRRAKQILTGATIMKSPDFSLNAGRFCLGVDASGVGYGAVLCQEETLDDGSVIERPVSYASKTLNAAERRRCATERELAAVDWAISQFSGYLIGAPTFRVWTDCRPLEAMFKKRPKNGRHYAIVLNLQMYDFTIEHRTASQMVVPDFLSRPPCAQPPVSDEGEDEAKEVRTEIRDEELEKENSMAEVRCLQGLSLLRNGGKDPRRDVVSHSTYKVEGRDSCGAATDAAFRWETEMGVQWTSTEPRHISDLAKQYGQEIKDDVYFVMDHNVNASVPTSSAHCSSYKNQAEVLFQETQYGSELHSDLTGSSSEIRPVEMMPTAFVGFCGGGGDTFGFKKAGFEILGGAEHVEKIRKVWERNFGVSAFSDVNLLNREDLMSTFTFSSSSPCTDMSSAGSQKGWMSKRTAQYVTQITAAIRARVPVIQLEQVCNASKIFKGQESLGSPQSVVVEKLHRAGYHVFDEPVNAAFVGGFVDRERLHTIAVSSELWEFLTILGNQPFEFKFPEARRPDLKSHNVVSNVMWPPPDDALVMKDDELSEFHFVEGVNITNPRHSGDTIKKGDQCTVQSLAPGVGKCHRRIRGRPLTAGVTGNIKMDPVSFKVAHRGRINDLGFPWSGNAIYHAGGMLRSVTAAGQTYWWYMEAPEGSKAYKHPSWQHSRNWCVRRLSAKEVAWFMGFRDNCELVGEIPNLLVSHIAGNAVSVDSAFALAREVKKQLWNEQFFSDHFRRSGTAIVLQHLRDGKEWDLLESMLNKYSRTTDAPYICQPKNSKLVRSNTETATWVVHQGQGDHFLCSALGAGADLPGQQKRDDVCRLMADPGISVIAVSGPQGTGKTYTAVLAILDQIILGKVTKLFISRTNIGTGDSNGLVPGTFAMKMKNLTAPIITSMEKAMQQRNIEQRLRTRILEEIIEVVPADQIRGWNIGQGEIFLLDEAQNTTDALMKVFMGRVGAGKVVLTGDPTGQPDKACCVGMRFLLSRVNKLMSEPGREELKLHIKSTFRHVEFTIEDNCRSTSSKGMSQLYDAYADPSVLTLSVPKDVEDPIIIWRRVGDHKQIFLSQSDSRYTLMREIPQPHGQLPSGICLSSGSQAVQKITQCEFGNRMIQMIELNSLTTNGAVYPDPGKGVWVTVPKGCKSIRSFHQLVPAKDFVNQYLKEDRILIEKWLQLPGTEKEEFNQVCHDEPRDSQLSDLREGTESMNSREYEVYRSVVDGIFPSYPTRFLAEFVNAWDKGGGGNSPMAELLCDAHEILVQMCEDGMNIERDDQCTSNSQLLFSVLQNDRVQNAPGQDAEITVQSNQSGIRMLEQPGDLDSALLFCNAPVRAYRSDCRARMRLIKRGIQIAEILRGRYPEQGQSDEPAHLTLTPDNMRSIRVNTCILEEGIQTETETEVHSLNEWTTSGGGESRIERFRRLQATDAFCGVRVQLIEKGVYPDDIIEKRILCTDKRQFAMIKGLLHMIDNVPSESGSHRRIAKIVVPNDLKSSITLAMHRDPLTMAHFGLEKTYSKMTQRFWWEGMHSDCDWIISSCTLCARLKR